ncbi:hypothetical protein PGT21_018142 [Puccinia graminis f. sp. tritici]|uniref:Uncharacterized protein n=1 Tax=Puccinia graminis f. sp. tritici TaxID=56615 RepID=A0A5B0QR42_PUCGR|nr:hypothetical protein PGT21_018142 [Puccinia graminis f. sp. tritici]KAA1115746.1 hypothetical protein PGTUg99_030072 [Puccinia graminis f. sp. tritici]
MPSAQGSQPDVSPVSEGFPTADPMRGRRWELPQPRTATWVPRWRLGQQRLPIPPAPRPCRKFGRGWEGRPHEKPHVAPRSVKVRGVGSSKPPPPPIPIIPDW